MLELSLKTLKARLMAVPQPKPAATYANQVKNARVNTGSRVNQKTPNERGSSWQYPRYQAANNNQKNIVGVNQNVKITKKISRVENKLLKMKAAWAIIAMTWWSVPFIILFGLSALAGVGGEMYMEDTLLGIASYFFPGEKLFVVSYAMLIIIGVCSMIAAATSFTFNRVNWFSGEKLIGFILCLAACFVPLPIPWMYLWLFQVVTLD